MNNSKSQSNTNNSADLADIVPPLEWINARIPNAKRVDFSDYSMSKYEFPLNVKEYIQQTWTRINDINGGEYQKPDEPSTTTTNSTVYGGLHMDENNQKALGVLLTKGSEEAIKYMMMHPETGHSISYAESRMLYG